MGYNYFSISYLKTALFLIQHFRNKIPEISDYKKSFTYILTLLYKATAVAKTGISGSRIVFDLLFYPNIYGIGKTDLSSCSLQ